MIKDVKLPMYAWIIAYGLDRLACQEGTSLAILPMTFMPNYITYLTDIYMSDGMTARDTECPVLVMIILYL